MKNSEITKGAREALAGNWGLAIAGFIIFTLLNSVGGVIALIIGGPLALGAAIFSLNIANKKQAELSQLFEGFSRFAEALVAYLLMVLYIVLWSLLFIVPGIIAAISYSQTFYILAEDKKISGNDALKKSKDLMYGKKWQYFCLGLRFLGWMILCVFTLGIGFLWLMPYMQVSYANFYKSLKK